MKLPSTRALRVVLVAAIVVAVAVVFHVVTGGEAFGVAEITPVALSYLSIFLLIAGDAVVPILPGETTLNAACRRRALAAIGDRFRCARSDRRRFHSVRVGTPQSRSIAEAARSRSQQLQRKDGARLPRRQPEGAADLRAIRTGPEIRRQRHVRTFRASLPPVPAVVRSGRDSVVNLHMLPGVLGRVDDRGLPAGVGHHLGSDHNVVDRGAFPQGATTPATRGCTLRMRHSGAGRTVSD